MNQATLVKGLGLVLLLAVAFYFFGNQLFGCIPCSWNWVQVGEISPLSTGQTVDVYMYVNSFNTQLLSQNKHIEGLSMYESCKYQIDQINLYKQKNDNRQYLDIRSGSTGFISPYGTGDVNSAMYPLCGGKYIKLWFSSAINCVNTTNPSPNDYYDYQTCSKSSVRMYILQSDIQYNDCTSGAKTIKCDDGSSVTTANCVNYAWVDTGKRCPSAPIVTPPSTPPSPVTPPSNNTIPPAPVINTSTNPTIPPQTGISGVDYTTIALYAIGSILIISGIVFLTKKR